MRVTVRPDIVLEIAFAAEPMALTIDVIEAAVNVFFATTQQQLQRLDAVGNPDGGFMLNSTKTPHAINPFVGRLYARAAVRTNIEVTLTATGEEVRQVSSDLPPINFDWLGGTSAW